MKKLFTLFSLASLLISGITLPAYSQLTYCTATSGDCTANLGNETISNFTLDSINNNSGCSPNSYADYTSTTLYPTLETTLVPGQTYNFSVTRLHADYASKYTLAVWIDYNQNGSFTDPNENVMTFPQSADCTITTVYCSDIIKSGSFTVPLTGTVPGVTRLRIRLIFHTDPVSPCGAIDYGESEDYRVIIAGTSSNTIAVGSITPTTYCAGDSIHIPFTETGSFTAGNVFTAQLSNGSGSFASPVTLGLLTDTTSGIINGVIPAGTSTGTGYIVQVIASTPSTISSVNSGAITINSQQPASVSINGNPSGAICSGTPVTFTATHVNGGTPSYQWQVNGTDVGTNLNTFSGNSFSNNDVITCVMTSNATCATGSPATSNAVTIMVNSSLTASVSIVADKGNTICSGTNVTFIATPVNGGAASYQWQVNGNNARTNDSIFSSAALNNSDAVTCVMTPNASCVSGSPITSNTINMIVTQSVAASVSIAVSPGNTICSGSSVTFKATSANGGTPSYQWEVNGTDVGLNVDSFSSASLNNADIVTCVMTSNASCVSNSPATSDSITMVVSASLPASVSISASPGNTICTGTSVTFTAVPVNGGIPFYQWELNGNNAGTDTNIFPGSSLNNNDIITCIMTSSASCATGSPATSNAVTMSVSAAVHAGTIVSSKDTFCEGTIAHLSLSGNSGGNIQWQSSSSSANFSNITGATATTYATNALLHAIYFRVYDSSGACSDTSPSVKINTVPSPVASFSFNVSSLKATFDASASTGASSYFWTFGDGDTSNTENPVHTFDSIKTYQVCLTVENSSNCTFTLCQNVALGPYGINNINNEAGWQIYPDPFTNEIYIEAVQANTAVESIGIYDLLGRRVLYGKINGVMDKPMKIDASNLREGVYYIRIETGSSSYVKSLMKQ